MKENCSAVIQKIILNYSNFVNNQFFKVGNIMKGFQKQYVLLKIGII